MSYSLHASAEQDLAGALAFYKENAGLLVAERFLDEFERVARLLVEYPDIGTPSTKGRRTYPLRVFPYSVVYRPMANGIRIIIVRHQRMKPGYGSARR
jgi:plasmid stabilization system protein ParE